MSVRIGINGMGRIGRAFFRLATRSSDLQVAAINDVAAPKVLAHLLEHDSVAGRWDIPIECRDRNLLVGDQSIPTSAARTPGEIPWEEAGVQLVIESSGLFTSRSAAAGHLRPGVQRVIISAPSPDADLTAVMGVNHQQFDPVRHQILSNASCTTQCLCPILQVVEDGIGILAGSMTTIHCYTNDQPLVDAPHRDLRRSRAAGLSMIPTTTSAARSLQAVQPDLSDRISCLAVRVPTAFVSSVDLTLSLGRGAQLEEVKTLFQMAESGAYSGIIGYTEKELVSADYRGDPRSAVVDGTLLALPEERFLKIFAWYDNESGYTHRLRDLIRFLVRREGII